MKKNEITIRSSAAEYLTYVASIGEQESSIEVRYGNENIWLTQKMLLGTLQSSLIFVISKIIFLDATVENFVILPIWLIVEC